MDYTGGMKATYEHTADFFVCNQLSECVCGQSTGDSDGINYCLRNENGQYEYVDGNSEKLDGKQAANQDFLNEKIQSLKQLDKYGDKEDRNHPSKYCMYPQVIDLKYNQDLVTFKSLDLNGNTISKWSETSSGTVCEEVSNIPILII